MRLLPTLLVAAVALLVIFCIVFINQLLAPSSPSPTCLTSDQVMAAVSQLSSAETYDECLSANEIDSITAAFTPCGMANAASLSPTQKYACQVAQVVKSRSGDFIPPGYTYREALFDKQDVFVGIRIVKTKVST
jgi:hypothetical protein